MTQTVETNFKFIMNIMYVCLTNFNVLFLYSYPSIKYQLIISPIPLDRNCRFLSFVFTWFYVLSGNNVFSGSLSSQH